MKLKASKLFLLVLVSLALVGCNSLSPAPGSVLFQDDFADTNSGWLQSADTSGITQYVQGAFRIAVDRPSTGKVSTPRLNFRDTQLEVDTIPLGGPQNNSFGLVCRYQDEQNFYFLTISSDRYYGIAKYKEGQLTVLTKGQMQTSEAIHEGNAPNHLRADCVGSSLSLQANGVELAQVEDTDFRNGEVGLIAATLKDPGVDILFDHFTVIQP